MHGQRRAWRIIPFGQSDRKAPGESQRPCRWTPGGTIADRPERHLSLWPVSDRARTLPKDVR